MLSLEKQIASIENELEKYFTQLDRARKTLDNKVKALEKTGLSENDMMPINENRWYSIRYDLNGKQIDASLNWGVAYDRVNELIRNIDKANKKLDTLTEEQNKLNDINNSLLERIEANKSEAIETFLNNWKHEAITYYESKGLLTDTPNYKNGEISLLDIEAERNRKANYIYSKVFNIIGNIKDATYITIGKDGNINGYLKGETKRCEVKTVLAGGYNIQCLHFRVLINELN